MDSLHKLTIFYVNKIHWGRKIITPVWSEESFEVAEAAVLIDEQKWRLVKAASDHA